MMRAVLRACACLLLFATASPATAQMAGAVGIPLPDSTLPASSVTVRVVNGPAMGAVAGVSVRLQNDGQLRETKTDSEGRAVFTGLRAGTSALAIITGAAGGDVASQPFAIAAQGGTRILLSPVPMGGASAAAPAPGSSMDAPVQPTSGAMPYPREMSGQARTMEGEPGGSLTVRLLHDSLTDPVAGGTVSLVGYHADGSVTFKRQIADAQGQARFDGLSRDGRVAYYAMVALPRDSVGDIIVDRVAGGPVLLAPEFGARMILSGAFRKSTEPPIDDTLWLAAKPAVAPTPGQVAVTVRGEAVREVALIDAATAQVVATQATQASGTELMTAQFAGVADGVVYYAQTTTNDGTPYRSAPFLAVAGRGVGIEVLATPPLRFRFHIVAAGIEDKQVGLQGEFTFYNLSWAPLAMGVDGFVLQTPVGSRGNLLMEGEEMSGIATPVGNGFALRRPLPPMLTSFQGGFSLPHEHGVMAFAWPLPHGAVDSSFLMVQLGDATLEVPAGTRVDQRTAQDGTKLSVVSDIQIMPGQSMVLKMRGLPIAPVWRTWLPTMAGLMVLLIFIGTAFLGYRGVKAGPTIAPPQARDAEIDALYARLAALPEDDASAEQREQLVAELADLLAHRDA
ncbi:MAG: carboxypeptidase regulatory-like domain-containing protein [Myxococcales bacterium]|nr:carboxypeptidase regulatory-like domain-containing protein [Myxococcales bacterium]